MDSVGFVRRIEVEPITSGAEPALYPVEATGEYTLVKIIL